MAGTLTIDTLRAGSGVLATQNGMTGIAKAWANFGYVSSSLTTRATFNISSITRNSTGLYTLVFTTAMPDANYILAGGLESQTGTSTTQIYAGSGGSGTAPTLKTTTQCQINFSAGGSLQDPYTASVMFLGN